MTTKKDGRQSNGGPRPGSGRPKKEPTVTVSFRIRPDQVKPINDVVNDLLGKSNRSARPRIEKS